MNVTIGDRIRFSVPVLRQWEDETQDACLVFRLKDVQQEPDGVKVLVLERDDEQR